MIQEEKLKKSETDHLRKAMHAVKVFSWEMDLHTKHFEYSPAAEEVLGFSIPEDGKMIRIIHPDDQTHFITTIDDAIETKNGYYAEYRLINPETGIASWYCNHGSFINTFTPDAMRLIGITHAVKRNKNVFSNYADPQLILQKALSIDTTGIIFFNNQGRFTNANDAFYRMYGYSQEEVATMQIDWQLITAPEYMDRSLQAAEELNSTGRILPLEKQYIRKDGSRFWALLAATKINDQESLAFVIDITEKKFLEQQKDEFIGIASHELKTPVTSIKAYAQVLEQIFTEAGDTRSAEMMTSLYNQVDKLTFLIQQLLDVTHLSNGQMPLNIEYFDITALIVEKAAELKKVSRGIQLVIQSPLNQFIRADKDRIGQVLINLISNAVKYSPQAAPIVITCNVSEHVLQVGIIDKGIGMHPELLNKIFDRFFRVRNPSLRNYPGLGLGLYISSEIIKRHQGTLFASSSPGEGSTFYFTLPVNSNDSESL